MSLAPAPPEPNGLHRFVRQQNASNITQTTTHHHNGGAALNTNLHTIDNSNSHDNSAAEKDMSQDDPDPDPAFTNECGEEHEIKHFSLDTRGDCLDNVMTYRVSGFKSRPSYEEILEQQEQEDPDEQIEITAMMIQPATNESSNTTEEGSSSSAVKPQPIHGRPQYNRGTLVQQVAQHVDAYTKHQGLSDEKRPRMTNTAPPSLWFKAIRATVV
jgi:hypothetical protein